jgi:hypothetical protein
MTTRFLPADATHLLENLAEKHAVLTLLGFLLLWSGLTALMRQRFHRGGMDLVVFALVTITLAIFVSTCLYVLATQPGYHF